MNEQELMQKLVMSKAIMDKSDEKKINGGRNIPQQFDEDYEYSQPSAKYNIPQEYLSEQNPIQQQYTSNPTKPVGLPTVDAIKNSKLPDEIKRLMMEHPIAQPQQQTTTLSNELIEKAARLMKDNKSGYVPESAKPTKKIVEQSEGINYGKIQKMIESAVNNALKENGLMVESTEKSNDVFSFRVGKHIFEGKVTKIKKVS
jgi:hypothetical protein